MEMTPQRASNAIHPYSKTMAISRWCWWWWSCIKFICIVLLVEHNIIYPQIIRSTAKKRWTWNYSVVPVYELANLFETTINMYSTMNRPTFCVQIKLNDLTITTCPMAAFTPLINFKCWIYLFLFRINFTMTVKITARWMNVSAAGAYMDVYNIFIDQYM